MRLPGKLIAFEGLDRAGKSTTAQALCESLSDCRVPIIRCGEKFSPLAPLLEAEKLKDLSAFLKTFFFAADRAWTYEKRCIPALEKGHIVLWDRYVDSAIAYRAAEIDQGTTDIDLTFVQDINRVFRQPELTFFIDISVKASMSRSKQTETYSPYKGKFLSIVREKYLAPAEQHGYIIIGGNRSLEEISQTIASIIRTRLKEYFP